MNIVRLGKSLRVVPDLGSGDVRVAPEGEAGGQQAEAHHHQLPTVHTGGRPNIRPPGSDSPVEMLSHH